MQQCDYPPGACSECHERLDSLPENADWIYSDPTHSRSRIFQVITCPKCGAQYEYVRTKICPISQTACLRDECMWWQRPAGRPAAGDSRRPYDDGRCGMLPIWGGI